MTQTQAIDILNGLSGFFKQYLNLRDECDESEVLSLCCPFTGGIHIYKGLTSIAKILELDVETLVRQASEYPVVKRFFYDGVMFYQIYSLEDKK